MNSKQLKLAIVERYKQVMNTASDPAVSESGTPNADWQEWAQNPKKWKRVHKETIVNEFEFQNIMVPAGSVLRIFSIPDPCSKKKFDSGDNC